MKDLINKFKKNPGTFNILGRNCAGVACAIFGTAGALPSPEIPGVDAPDTVSKLLRDHACAKCYKGYTKIGLDGKARVIPKGADK